MYKNRREGRGEGREMQEKADKYRKEKLLVKKLLLLL